MEEKKHYFLHIIKGIGIAYIITIILLMIYAALLAYTSIPESSMPLGVLVISMISIFISSSLSVKKIKERGLIYGAMIGFFYILILYFMSSIFIGFSLNSYSLTTMFFNALIGMVGGVIGVNL